MNLAAHLSRPSSPMPLRDREVAVLRLVGRLGITQGVMIRGLVLPDLSESAGRELLRRLVARKLLWHGNRSNHDAAGRLQGRTPRVYGLTEEGRQLLDTFGVESRPDTLQQFVVRAKHAPTPASFQLADESYVSDWCAILLDQVRRHRTFVGAHVQRRYSFIDPAGTVLQTVGALIVLAFDKAQRVAPPPGCRFPWLAGGRINDSWLVVYLALEVCPSLMDQRALVQLAQTYQQFSAQGLYRSWFSGPLRPVIITETPQEAERLGALWTKQWPTSPGMISSKDRTSHSEYGVLWGSYTSLANPAQQMPLLGPTLGSVEQWPAKIAQWPAVPATASMSPVT